MSSIEVKAVKSIIRALISAEGFYLDIVTVCATYSMQVFNLKCKVLDWLEERIPDAPRDKINFSTVAGVQGKMKDVLIYTAKKTKRRVQR